MIYYSPCSLLSFLNWQSFPETAAGDKTADSAFPVVGKSKAARLSRESSAGIIGVVTADGSVIEHQVVNHGETSAASSSLLRDPGGNCNQRARLHACVRTCPAVLSRLDTCLDLSSYW